LSQVRTYFRASCFETMLVEAERARGVPLRCRIASGVLSEDKKGLDFGYVDVVFSVWRTSQGDQRIVD
jgi:hypothetical protein